ncbi:MAG: FxsA family protein [Spirochaetia bacterium]
MRELRLFVQFIEKDFLFKLILALLVYSLIPLAEIVFFIYLGSLLGSWLVLVVAALVGLPGVLVAHSQLQDILGRLRAKMRDGQYPGPEAVDLLALLVGGVFLVTPGFLTDVLGYLMLVPFVRNHVARALARKMSGGLKDFYDYLRLREI